MSGDPVAVLGSGSVGSRHLSVLRLNGTPPPVAVPVRAGRAAKLRGRGLDAADTLEEAASRGARACVIATDTGRHVADALRALSLGMDVLVEKPLAASAPDAARVADEAARRGRKAFVACVLRFSESLERFRELLPEIGAPHAIRIECRSYLPDWRPDRPYKDSYSARATEGGVLRDLIHEVDYAGWFFGWPSAVCGRLANLGRLGIQAEETADLYWRAPGGLSVSVSLDYLARTPVRRMEAWGEKGALAWDGAAQTVTATQPGAEPRVWRSAQDRDGRFLLQARAFLAALDGKPDPRLATAAEGVRALQVCDAARRSSESGREEAVA